MKNGRKKIHFIFVSKITVCAVLILVVCMVAACGGKDAFDTFTDENEPLITDSVEYLPQAASEAYEPLTASLPTVIISLPARNLDRNQWRGTTVSLQDAGKYSFAPVIARVRGRGNSTWRYMGEKRPVRIRFSEARHILGSNYAATDWNLVSNASDYSLVRSYAAYHLGYLLRGQDFGPTHHLVHVYTDGDYRGVYLLTDQMHVHEGRVELSFHEDPAQSEYFVQWCRHSRDAGDVYFFVGEGRNPFELRFPGGRQLTNKHTEFANEFLDRVDAAMISMDYDAIAALIDIPSFVDFYLVNEFFKNVDVGFSSVFFQIRQTDTGPRLFAGPLWDFDQSSGGSYVSNWYTDYSPQRLWVVHANHWLRNFVIVPELIAYVAERWNQIRDNEICAMISHINEISVRYRSCFNRNFERWPNKLSNYLWRTPRTVMTLETHEKQTDYLLDWFRQRVIWLDEFLLEN